MKMLYQSKWCAGCCLRTGSSSQMSPLEKRRSLSGRRTERREWRDFQWQICSGRRPRCLSWRRLARSWSPASSSSSRRCAGAAWPGKSTGCNHLQPPMMKFWHIWQLPTSRRMVAARLVWAKYRKYKMRTWVILSSSKLSHKSSLTSYFICCRYVNTLQKTFKDCRSMKVRACFLSSSL